MSAAAAGQGPAESDPVRWRFGPFEADLHEQQLRRDGEVVPVTRKSFALLTTLLVRPGRLFTKAELFETVWAGTVVTDAALSRAIRELRVALGDDAGAPAYIATAHGLGFRFIAAVDTAGGPSSPARSPVQAATAGRRAGAPGVVGRDAELALLEQSLATAVGGERQAVFVTGEAGIGKTSIVDALVARHAPHGAPWIAQGRCIEQYGTGEAYLPVLEALESLARQAGGDKLRSVLLRYAPAWLAQLPWLAHDADPAILRRALEGTSAQRMLREFAQALEVLASEQPIVLWLEDLHWSDYSTLDVVSFVAGRRERARLLLVCSYRPADASGNAFPLARMVQGLVQRGQARELALALLGARAIAAYLRSRLDPCPLLEVDELAQFLHRRTEGNALFTVALVDHLVRSGQLVQGEHGWALAAPVSELGTAMPDSLRQLVQHQIDQLGEDDLRLVEAAAVAGTDFGAAALAAALCAEVADVEERCLRLAQAGRFLRPRAPVAWPDGTESAGFGFLHALYWQGTYERIAQARRAEWHLRIAQREEQAYGSQSAQIATELAMRFEAARDPARSLHYLRQAGAAALVRCAYLECVDLLRHALDLVQRLPAAQQPRHELDVLLPLGAALMAVQGYASPEVEATYQRALDVGRAVSSVRELERALRGLWNVALVRSDLARAQTVADELVVQAAAGGNPSAAFDAFAKQGQTCLHRGDFGAARRHLEYALSMPIAADDPARLRETPRVAAYLAWVLWYTGHPAQALSRAEQALDAANRAASPHSTAFALGFVGWLHVFRGETGRMRELALQQMTLSVEHDLAYWKAWSESLLGLAQAYDGDGERGCARMFAAMEAFADMGAEVGVSHFVTVLAEAELAGGRPAQARQTLQRAAAMLERNGNAYHAAETARVQGVAAWAEGAHGDAQRHLERALAIARAQGARALELRAASSLASLWADRGRCSDAAALLGPVYAQFGEGWDTEDLVRAGALLERLSG